MATTRHTFSAPIERVEQVLLDAHTYPQWIVGTDHCESVDDVWPRPGGTFRYTVKIGPLSFHDHTTMVGRVPGESIELIVSVRPLGRVRVILRFAEDGPDHTVVEMTEYPVNFAGRLLWNRVADRLLHWRNMVSLERLEPILGVRAA